MPRGAGLTRMRAQHIKKQRNMAKNGCDDQVPSAREVPSVVPQRLVELNPILLAGVREREVRDYVAPRYCNYNPEIVKPEITSEHFELKPVPNNSNFTIV